LANEKLTFGQIVVAISGAAIIGNINLLVGHQRPI